MQARLSTKSDLSYVSDHIHYIVIWPKSRGPYSAEWRNDGTARRNGGIS